MQLRNLFTDDDAVSPVIGVILMVAITVILAAVIGAFVLGLGQGQDAAPTAGFEWDGTNSTNITLAMKSGESIDYDELDVTCSGCTSNTPFAGSGTFTAGMEVVATTAGNSDAGDVTKLVWSSSTSDKSGVLTEYEVPA